MLSSYKNEIHNLCTWNWLIILQKYIFLFVSSVIWLLFLQRCFRINFKISDIDPCAGSSSDYYKPFQSFIVFQILLTLCQRYLKRQNRQPSQTHRSSHCWFRILRDRNRRSPWWIHRFSNHRFDSVSKYDLLPSVFTSSSNCYSI